MLPFSNCFPWRCGDTARGCPQSLAYTACLSSTWLFSFSRALIKWNLLIPPTAASDRVPPYSPGWLPSCTPLPQPLEGWGYWGVYHGRLLLIFWTLQTFIKKERLSNNRRFVIHSFHMKYTCDTFHGMRVDCVIGLKPFLSPMLTESSESSDWSLFHLPC